MLPSLYAITERLLVCNLSFYFLSLIIVEWCISSLTRRGIARRLGIKFATVYVCDITFLGVIHHELSHALLALITGAAIQEVCLYRPLWIRKKKRNEPEEGCLGYVTYVCRGVFPMPQIQNALTGVAPAILGSVTVLLCGMYLCNSWQIAKWDMLRNGWTYATVFLMVSVAQHACPSEQDIKNARAGLALLFIVGTIFPLPTDIALVVAQATAVVLGVYAFPAIPFILVANLMPSRKGK